MDSHTPRRKLVRQVVYTEELPSGVTRLHVPPALYEQLRDDLEFRIAKSDASDSSTDEGADAGTPGP